ncbi:chloride channel protein [bacterium]|nr:chloride channel protein [bacterium]
MAWDLLKPAGEAAGRPRGPELGAWLTAVLVGVIAGGAVSLMRVLIAYGEFMMFDASRGRLGAAVARLDWWAAMLAPVVGGLLVSLLLLAGSRLGWGPSPRPFGLQELIRARRLRARLQQTTLSLRDSLLSALIAVISLGAGASGGRECPSMHLGASLALLPGRLFGVDLPTRRIFLGMGAAAGLAGALLAPFAAVVFVRELILPRQRLLSLGPIVLAALTAWLVVRAAFSGAPIIAAPALNETPAGFFLLIPLFAALMWALSELVTVLWRNASARADVLAQRLHAPPWTLPAFGGALIGLLGYAFPQVLGVGYDPLSAALNGGYAPALMVVLCFAKTAATAISTGFRFGGGLIAPALFVGAMAGGGFGAAVDALGLTPGGAEPFFAVVGMGALCGAIMGTPAAMGVFVLELTGRADAAIMTLACGYIMMRASAWRRGATGDTGLRPQSGLF